MANGNGRNGHAKLFKAIEETLHEAFSNAQASRRLVGLAKLEPDIQQRKSGLQWIGPEHYKTTVWWQPWEFVDLLRAKEHAKFRGGLLAFIKHLALEAIPQTAARPPSRAERAKLRDMKPTRAVKAAAA